jgi:hypothetical protein
LLGQFRIVCGRGDKLLTSPVRKIRNSSVWELRCNRCETSAAPAVA